MRIVNNCLKEYELVVQITYSLLLTESSAFKLNFLKKLTINQKHFTKTTAESSYEPEDISIHFDWWLKKLIHS